MTQEDDSSKTEAEGERADDLAGEPGEGGTERTEKAPAADEAGAPATAGPEELSGARRPLIQTPARVIVALVCAVIAAISLLWIGGEEHYQSCVTAAAARSAGANDALSRLVRGRAVNDCSRWPF